jgi:hypothetical protein
VPLHAGYLVHPQNSLPASAPRLAVRSTIALAHTGHDGVVAGAAAVGVAAGPRLGDSGPRETAPAALACLIIPKSFGPSTRRIFLPSAKALASSVKRPEVTTKPPAAP